MYRKKKFGSDYIFERYTLTSTKGDIHFLKGGLILHALIWN